MATFQVSPPDRFNFKQPDEWPKWIKRFARFRLASRLNTKDGNLQVSTLVYSMGEEAEDILATFRLNEQQVADFDVVKTHFENFFTVRRNVIFERAKFNTRLQEPGETVDSFITALYGLAEHCAYGTLQDNLIHDRIVVGIRDTGLSERLQLDGELTLEKAIKMARQSETVKRQQPVVRNTASEMENATANVEAIKGGNFKHHKNKKWKNHHKSQPCHRCGKSQHRKVDYPAVSSTCRKCQKKGHWDVMCQNQPANTSQTSKKRYAVSNVEGLTEENDCDYAFLGSVEDVSPHSSFSDDPWYIDLLVDKRGVVFKIDTGADVTVIPEFVHKEMNSPPLKKSNRILYGKSVLKILGKFTATLKSTG
ncbi:uncharacterized protein [Haliotis cracherodii]|uniref:uncharacterized protein n=1 Tax=Haliotis cracherodii TaxID=6455 RepID=UPI0039E864E2